MQLITTNQSVIAFTVEEARWLRDLFQNPIYEDESREEAMYRKRFFEVFKALVIHNEPTLAEIKCSSCVHRYEEDDIPF